MRLDRPIGTILLLWPTLWALWIAGQGHPDPAIVVIFMLGVLVMRSAGCIINDFADRKIDPHIERTQMRPMATGDVSTREALTLFTALSLFALGLVLQLNWETVLLAIPAVLLTISYPFVKRITHFPQVFLGVAFAWGIPMAFAAQTGTVPLEAWWLLSVNLFWVVGYDTLYAMVDREDDLKIGVRSTA
ncbi:MAG: 4-hydroxybenzoate octaprenyltransferase, partial [Arenicellales bacterium]|nr:4-hydroxybenzoate octaprenyltransferase [Arenicellales bacterium]